MEKYNAPSPRAWVSSFIIHPSSFSSAFTLLELILVMLLISIALAEAAPELRGFLTGSGLKNATTDLVAATQWARTQAISEGQTYRLLVDRNGYQVECQNQQSFVPINSPMGKRFDLPSDIQLELQRQDNGVGDHIDFFGDGTTEAGTFTLTQNNNSSEKIVCLSPSERFHVDSGGGK